MYSLFTNYVHNYVYSEKLYLFVLINCDSKFGVLMLSTKICFWINNSYVIYAIFPVHPMLYENTWNLFAWELQVVICYIILTIPIQLLQLENKVVEIISATDVVNWT